MSMIKPNHWLFLACGALLAASTVLADPTRTLHYEYERIGYDREARHNPVARLAEHLENGEVTLEYREERGYLDSFLEELGIDPSSQVLVFSPTSLQYKRISPETPRALFFSEDTYIGWVQGSNIVEIATVDAELGTVFYVFNNIRNPGERFERPSQQCLVCHDSQGAMGGGVPLLMALSAVYSEKNANLKSMANGGNIDDRTPVDDRWGGWYVTGWNGDQPHLGNVMLSGREELPHLDEARRGNLVTLEGEGFFDTGPYPRATSDIVALLVMEHQITVQNELTYVKFKAPAVLARTGLQDAVEAPSWEALPERARRILPRMLDKLVDRMLFVDAATYKDRIAGLREFEDWFLAQGPRDDSGRSLRDFDLGRRLFKYPLSYLVYSDAFNTLPAYAKDYVYQRFADVLLGRDDSEAYAHLSRADRKAILEILRDTKPDFVPYIEGGRQALSATGR